MHKVSNLLGKFPKSMAPTVKSDLRDIWQAETRAAAAAAIDTFAETYRHRTVRTKRALSQRTAKLMVFTLVRAASTKWRRLTGANQLSLVLDGIKFTDGVALSDAENRAA